MEQFVKITLNEYTNLIRNDCQLAALHAIGVDNWSGWGEHRDTYKELVKGALSEESLNKVIIKE